MHAAHSVRAAPRHLAVSGVTPRVERECTHTRNSGRLKVAIFLRKGHIPAMYAVTGTCFALVQPAARYKKASGEYYTSLPGVEYSRLVDAARGALSGPAAGGASTKGSQPRVILHDLASPHTPKCTASKIAGLGMKEVRLPTHCPDLCVHDATFLGTVMSAYQKACCEKQLTWAEKQRLFISLVLDTNPSPHIDRWVKVLQACIDMRGGHVERSMKRRAK
jgi:hypothetical protein